MEKTILQNKYTIKKNVKSKFKEKMWCDKELEENRKLRYYKDVINPNLEDQNYLYVFLLDCPAYTHIRSHFQNIDHTTNRPNLLTQQKYGDLGKFLLMLFEHKKKILKNHK